MELINVVVAAVAGWMVGAVWYMVFADPWMEAVGIKKGPDGKPESGQSPILFAFSFVMILLVSGMMRHTFELGNIDTLGKGLVSGIGVGLFFITPWIALNNGYAGRPPKLTVIDGGYAVVACAVIGLVLTLF